MKYFSLKEFTVALEESAKLIPRRIETRLAEAGELIKKEAQSYIGEPHSDWPPLKESTLRTKETGGFGAKGPLDRTGAMRDSIECRLLPYEVIVESFNKALYFHETGTTYMPKRPVLTRAVFKNQKKLLLLLGTAVYPLITMYHIPE